MTGTSPALTFNHSETGTLGVEMEWMTVDKQNGKQVPAAPELLTAIEPTPRIKAELFTSTVEINSGIHQQTATCIKELSQLHAQVSRKLDAQQAALLAGGTHPFSPWKEQQVSDDPRYHRLIKRLCWPARRFNIFGIHVHVGMPDGDTCIAAMNRMMPIMPVFLAISANSPFWCGHDTGLSSARVKVFEGLSQGGMPFYFEDWADFESCAQRLTATGSIDSVRDIWWEMRPHPDFGTLEVRIGDMPATQADALAYVAYVRAEVELAARSNTCAYRKIHPSIIRENRWRACRYGINAEIIDPVGEKVVPLLDWLDTRLDTLTAKNADATDIAIVGKQIAEWRRQGDGASRQRHLHRQYPLWDDMLKHMRQDGWNDEL
ncbi:MAG: YbdK family carboxylate-amine ligase [Mariprofundaceae bacterium]